MTVQPTVSAFCDSELSSDDSSESQKLRWWGVVVVVLALVAAACGDDGSAETADGTDTSDDVEVASDESELTDEVDPEVVPPSTDDEAVELTASWKGVTEDSISLAVSILDFGALQDLGLQEWGWGDQRLVWDFYVDQINERGGFGGRQLDVELDFYNPAFGVDAEASCLRMTEDREVFAVIGAFVGPAQSATPCLTGQEDLVIIGGSMTVDLLEGSNAVWVNPGNADRRRIPGFFQLLEQEGYLDDRPIAIVSGNEDLSSTEDVINPLLDEAGANVVVRAVNTVPTDDVAGEDRFWENTAELIKSEGAEVIIINGDTSGAIRGIGLTGLDQELWVVTTAQLTNLGSTVDRSDADGAITLGGATPQEQWEEPAMVACVDEFRNAHPDIEIKGPLEVGELEEKWYIELQVVCRRMALFEILVEAAGPDLTPATVQAAYENLGEIELPGYFFASLGPGKPDAADGFRLSEWDSTSGDAGALVPLTDLLDITP